MSATGSQVSDRNFRFGPFELNEREGELRKDGIRIKVQEQPFQVLHELVANAGKIVPREHLQNRLWPEDTFVDFNVGVNTAIRKLRLALNDDADKPRYIETVSKRGYRFIAEVVVHEATSVRPALESASPDSVFLPPIVVYPHTEPPSTAGAEVITPAGTNLAETVPQEPPRRRRRKVLLAIAILGLAIVGRLVYSAMQPYPVPNRQGVQATHLRR